MNIHILIVSTDQYLEDCEYLSSSFEHALQDYSKMPSSSEQPKIDLVVVKSEGYIDSIQSNFKLQISGISTVEVAIFYNPDSEPNITKLCDLYARTNAKVKIYYTDRDEKHSKYLSSIVEFVKYDDNDQVVLKVVNDAKESIINEVQNGRSNI